LGIRHEIAARFWTAVAERSGDTALGRTGEFQSIRDGRAHENGVALRFPPQSKMLARGPIVLNHGGHSFSETALPVHKPENRNHQQDADEHPQSDEKLDLLLMCGQASFPAANALV
jgi:hypothetical protein